MGNLILQGGFGGGSVEQIGITFEHHARFCEKNEIDYQVRIAKWQHKRKANWNKVKWIIEAIETRRYNTILWMDADTMIVKPFEIDEVLRKDSIVGMVQHSRHDPVHWNSGLIFTRSNRLSYDFWNHVWAHGRVEGSGWQDQPRINKAVELEEFRDHFQPLPPQYNYQQGLMDSVDHDDVIIKAWHGVKQRHTFMRKHMDKVVFDPSSTENPVESSN